jgi:hypothetical protein
MTDRQFSVNRRHRVNPRVIQAGRGNTSATVDNSG